ncbi:SARP family transcriptional regulator [Actinomadura sp. NBRC 104412]|uniref:BTAD domain-containing putative transcriptional regulator n=1 Tax=Actinomadura sp. NBRC 104412 TaxID=3032203 RepID=UPI0024A18F98|nr:BTAD domain-containing putative transcriptional regulator [Actinomadura sp. NBRC 104412]GLZ05242.1 SARP family transcriptional regulator [Actinomadura sp. NBRC 104412]
MEFRILGGLEVVHAGASLALGGPRHRRLLAVLLLNAGATVSKGRLVEALWGDDPPKSAPEMLYVRVCELRAALRAGRPEPHAGLLNRDGGYVLRAGADELDFRRFERLAAEGTGALAEEDHVRAAALLGDALALWRGPALAEFADQPFARAEAARLDALRLRVLESRLEADLALGRHGDLVGELKSLVGEHPLHERFWCQYLLALYRTGRQGEALAAFHTARRRLQDELGIEPGADLRRVHAAILRQDASLNAHAAVPGNLPARLAGFIGRHRDIAEVRALVRENRLVTLTGVGGVGKTRLAVEAAAGLQAEFPGGVWLVDLAAVTRPGLVVPAVAAALGVREHPRRPLADVLAAHLRSAATLIVLDNCEHLVEEAAEAAGRLLGACPGLRILATGRERLGLAGEVLRPVEGLDVPPPDDRDPESVGRAEAVRLLLARAAAVRPGFALTGATAAPIAEICRRLDGLPLAIELVASSANAFGPAQLAERLDDRFRLPTRGDRAGPRRHRTLRAVVDWGYDLLDEAERRLFDRLSVFVGGFTLDAAEAVCGGSADGGGTAARLARLVDTSMVAADHGDEGTPRYRMLETLRAYGTERLAQSGDADAVRDRHAAYVLSMVGSARAALRDARQAEWGRRLEDERGNIRAALDWSIGTGDARTATRLVGALYKWWDQQGHYREGGDWCERVLAMKGRASPADTARALNAAAAFAAIRGDLPRAVAASERAAALSRRAGYPAGLADALLQLGVTAINAGEAERAAPPLEEALGNARAAGNRWLEGRVLVFLALAALSTGEAAGAVRRLADAEAVLRPVGDTEGLAWARTLHAMAAWHTGDQAMAARLLGDGARGFQDLGHLWGLSICVLLAGLLAGARGDHGTAVTRLAGCEALLDRIGVAPTPLAQEWREAADAMARDALDVPSYERARRQGRAMTAAAAAWHSLCESKDSGRSPS